MTSRKYHLYNSKTFNQLLLYPKSNCFQRYKYKNYINKRHCNKTNTKYLQVPTSLEMFFCINQCFYNLYNFKLKVIFLKHWWLFFEFFKYFIIILHYLTTFRTLLMTNFRQYLQIFSAIFSKKSILFDILTKIINFWSLIIRNQSLIKIINII